MRFSEIYDTLINVYTKDNYKKIDNLSNLGAFSYPTPITDKENINTPHYIMDRCLSMASENSIVSSAVEQVIMFIFPQKKLRVKSKSKKTEKWLNKWIKLRPDISEEMYKILFTNVATGNGIMQYVYNKEGKLDNVYALNDVSRIYYNPDHKSKEDEYVYAIPLTVKEFYFDGKLQKPEFFNVKYVNGDAFFVKQVYGIPVSGEKIARYKTGWSREGFYGRSSLASCLDVDNIMREIMSSWDTISKLKQIDQKIITPDGNGMIDIANQQYQELIRLLEEGRGGYLFLPFQVKLLQQDIRTSKGYDTMVEVMEFLRRQIMMGLLPQFLTPWGESSTTQGSESSLPPFLARIKCKQGEFIQFLNNNLLNKLLLENPELSEDATFVLDAPEVMGETYYIKMISGLKRDGLITSQQAITWMKHLGIIDESIFNEELVEEKVVDPFRVMDKNAISFKPTDDDARRDALRIEDAIKQREQQQKYDSMYNNETTEVVNNTMTDARTQVVEDSKPTKKSKKKKEE
jgi:hypothetical protein